MYVGDWAVSQLWLFWVAPIVGGVLGAVIYKNLLGKESND
ncbi:putative membrane protein [Vibrio parahaemolyticus VPTS-2010]|nr:putative membrane protein [Vibrio parahaemolyticus VPTS-2010]